MYLATSGVGTRTRSPIHSVFTSPPPPPCCSGAGLSVMALGRVARAAHALTPFAISGVVSTATRTPDPSPCRVVITRLRRVEDRIYSKNVRTRLILLLRKMSCRRVRAPRTSKQAASGERQRDDVTRATPCARSRVREQGALRECVRCAMATYREEGSYSFSALHFFTSHSTRRRG